MKTLHFASRTWCPLIQCSDYPGMKLRRAFHAHDSYVGPHCPPNRVTSLTVTGSLVFVSRYWRLFDNSIFHAESKIEKSCISFICIFLLLEKTREICNLYLLSNVLFIFQLHFKLKIQKGNWQITELIQSHSRVKVIKSAKKMK